MNAPFEGLKVVAFTPAVAGPLIAKCLADFGATVVAVESKRHVDITRVSAPFKDGTPGINRSGNFAIYNPNKLSMSVDLDHPKAAIVTKGLTGWADVVVDAFTPGVMERWGLGYEDLAKVKSDIIMLRTSNQGQSGPYSRQPGLGYHLVGLAGFANLIGWPDRDPVMIAMAYTDIIVPRFGIVALIAALDYRRRTGKGQCLDLSQLEATVHFLAPAVLDFVVNGRVANRAGNCSPGAAPHGVYRCKGDDRWCSVAVSSAEDWHAFCSVVNASWVSDPRFTTLLGRKRNELELDRLVEAWTVNFRPEEIMMRLQPSVPAGLVENARDRLENAQFKWRGYFWRLNHREIGPLSHLGQPFELSGTPAQPRLPAPCLGEHTEMVCRKFLGMSDEEFVALVNDGILE